MILWDDILTLYVVNCFEEKKHENTYAFSPFLDTDSFLKTCLLNINNTVPNNAVMTQGEVYTRQTSSITFHVELIIIYTFKFIAGSEWELCICLMTIYINFEGKWFRRRAPIFGFKITERYGVPTGEHGIYTNRVLIFFIFIRQHTRKL